MATYSALWYRQNADLLAALTAAGLIDSTPPPEEGLPDTRRGVWLTTGPGNADPRPVAKRYPMTTDAEYNQAVSIIDGFDWTGANDPGEQLRAQAAAAIAALATYKALASPTAAQRLAFERRVCDILTVLIKRVGQLVNE